MADNNKNTPRSALERRAKAIHTQNSSTLKAYQLLTRQPRWIVHALRLDCCKKYVNQVKRSAEARGEEQIIKAKRQKKSHH